MGKPAARISDMHVCPKRTGKIPHVGGPILAGSSNVFIGGLPAARVGDMAVCVGPPDKIKSGSSGVLINEKPAARLGDSTVHGGLIIAGCPTVLIGDGGGGGGGSGQGGGAIETLVKAEPELDITKYTQAAALTAASRKGKDFCEICGK
ncbi:hypothetical protein MNBD_GAMMA04-492 [hydrothermal vent metagenome]|uniref:Type VI secretion protein n=1 Tax=hydrothermal vent metagenome TaxID=652676 RepID=A0A3B0WGM1_9ZZZZ